MCRARSMLLDQGERVEERLTQYLFVQLKLVVYFLFSKGEFSRLVVFVHQVEELLSDCFHDDSAQCLQFVQTAMCNGKWRTWESLPSGLSAVRVHFNPNYDLILNLTKAISYLNPMRFLSECPEGKLLQSA